jgi:hypothetical protein
MAVSSITTTSNSKGDRTRITRVRSPFLSSYVACSGNGILALCRRIARANGIGGNARANALQRRFDPVRGTL